MPHARCAGREHRNNHAPAGFQNTAAFGKYRRTVGYVVERRDNRDGVEGLRFPLKRRRIVDDHISARSRIDVDTDTVRVVLYQPVRSAPHIEQSPADVRQHGLHASFCENLTERIVHSYRIGLNSRCLKGEHADARDYTPADPRRTTSFVMVKSGVAPARFGARKVGG